MSRRSLSSPSVPALFYFSCLFSHSPNADCSARGGRGERKAFPLLFSGNVNCSQSAAPFPPLVVRYSRHMHFLPPPPSLPRLWGHETWKVSKFGHLVSLQDFCGNSRFCGEKSWDPSSRPPKQSRRISVRKNKKKSCVNCPKQKGGSRSAKGEKTRRQISGVVPSARFCSSEQQIDNR